MSLFNWSRRNAFKLQALQRRYQQTQANVQSNSSQLFTITGPAFTNAPGYADRVALRDKIGSYTFTNLFISANELSKEITKLVNGKTKERVMFLCPNNANYVITLWAIWMSGQIAVPLSPLHPKNILLYYASDTNSSLLITTSEYADLMQKVSRNSQTPLHVLDNKLQLNCIQNLVKGETDFSLGLPPSFYDTNNALILYTSGTTGNPKGVVLSHKNLNFQVSTLLDAWKWSSNDVLLHTLPLHHVHGIVNALLCPLYIGAKTIMLEKFNANMVWSYLLGVGQVKEDRKISVYMAVPTIYSKLMDEYDKVFYKDPKMVEHIKNILKTKIRLMVSGSAPLPAPIHEKWFKISGHKLLERYGMTEIGMCLSNEYESDREPGYVGVPLPGVSIKLTSVDNGSKDLLEATNKNGQIQVNNIVKEGNPSGELLVKSDGVFQEYFKRPEATKAEFADGWFKTGDICEYSSEKKKFKILGRKSVDIIKSGGYKLSALQIETELLTNPLIKDVAVVGIADPEWGERVAAIIVPEQGAEMSLESLSTWAKTKLPKYSIPSVLKIVNTIPKNAMGKINKKELVKTLF